MSEEVDATIGILETYHQKGGTYVIPVEVINDVESLLEEQQQEIERLNNIIKQQDTRNSIQRIANRKLLERNQDLVIEDLKLNNIMTELEAELYTKYHEHKDSECEELYAKSQEDKEILDYIKELKGSDKE